MTPLAAIATLRIRLPYGQIRHVELPLKSPRSTLTSGVVTGTTCPPCSENAYSRTGAGDGLPVPASLTGRDRGARSTIGGIFPPNGREEKSLTAELAEIRAALADKALLLARLDGRLAPYWEASGELKQQILETHFRDRGTIRLDLSNKEARAPLFQKLSALSVKWGPVQTQRRAVDSEIKSLERHAQHLERALKRERDRANRKQRSA